MDATVTDLDKLVEPRKKVSLGGRIYEVPGDLPLEVFLKLNLAGQQEDNDEGTALLTLVDAIVDLLSWEAADSDRAEVRANVEPVIRRLGVRAISRIISTIYREDDEPETAEEAEEPVVPTQAETSTTSNSGSEESPTTTSTPTTTPEAAEVAS